MFCNVSKNWRAMPLVNLYAVIAPIANITTKKQQFSFWRLPRILEKGPCVLGGVPILRFGWLSQ